jgi:ACS family glucarate transporter-like MFS transporter
MFNWVFFYLVKVRGFPAQHAGYFTSIQWYAAAVGATLGGFVCDYLCRKKGMRLGCRWPAMLGLALSGLFMLVGSISTNPLLAVGMLALAFLANQITESAFWAAAISVGGRNAATSSGVMNTGGNACGIVNALLVPFVAGTLGWTAAMITGTVFAALGAILWLFIDAGRTVAD